MKQYALVSSFEEACQFSYVIGSSSLDNHYDVIIRLAKLNDGHWWATKFLEMKKDIAVTKIRNKLEIII